MVADPKGKPKNTKFKLLASDTTPMLTRGFSTSQLPESAVERRELKSLNELLVERGYLARRQSAGDLEACHLVKAPSEMCNGKGVWPCYEMLNDFFPVLEAEGHCGIAMHHYVFDRALSASLRRKVFERHEIHRQEVDPPCDIRTHIIETFLIGFSLLAVLAMMFRGV